MGRGLSYLRCRWMVVVAGKLGPSCSSPTGKVKQAWVGCPGCAMPEKLPPCAWRSLLWGCLRAASPNPHSLQTPQLKLQLKQAGTEKGCGAGAAQYLCSYL